jgi:hypothetical protein
LVLGLPLIIIVIIKKYLKVRNINLIVEEIVPNTNIKLVLRGKKLIRNGKRILDLASYSLDVSASAKGQITKGLM